jgi:antitoxin-like ribbon-helix-helix protein
MIGLGGRARRKGKNREQMGRDQIERELNTSGGKISATGGYVVPPSRRNRRSLTTWQDEAAVQALKEIGLTRGRTIQALIAEGINHVLVKHGKPPLADEN